ncbi:hypothetical protein AGR3A_Cc120038 [Agrobacterium tomkonis CFBP 6623]|uniref:Uncharacterized protein n=1 Tax=Agrobacterium tomkonis CFBP 6623 TaxID=1183432 RepID=A0A1S7NMI1_9HYPH|nr:hypothetical protein AGR3A_Cc120038 [Agrobacterium tomkonis CFBP 6623]
MVKWNSSSVLHRWAAPYCGEFSQSRYGNIYAVDGSKIGRDVLPAEPRALAVFYRHGYFVHRVPSSIRMNLAVSPWTTKRNGTSKSDHQ